MYQRQGKFWRILSNEIREVAWDWIVEGGKPGSGVKPLTVFKVLSHDP